jgi:hypothetical protein
LAGFGLRTRDGVSRTWRCAATLIEPFPENQRDDILFGRVFDPAFEAGIADLLKSDLAYTITVNVYAFNDLRGQRLAEVRAELLAWARVAVPRLPEPPRGQGPTEVRISAEQLSSMRQFPCRAVRWAHACVSPLAESKECQHRS